MHDNRIDTLDGIADASAGKSGLLDGSVTFNVDSEVQGGASLSILNADIDWMNARFRLWVMVNNLRWPLGVYIPASPEESHTSGLVTTTVSLLDKTSLLSTSMLPASLSVPVGTVVTDKVRDILVSKLGFDPGMVALTPSSKKLVTALVWAPGTTYLQVLKDLLGAIAYNPIWADGWGRFRSEPWIDPRTASPSIEFVEGELSIHMPDFSVSQDMSSVPNRVTCVSAGDDTKPALVSVATNLDPASPTSWQARGQRWVDAFYDGVEATDQKTLDTIAQRHLAETAVPPWYVTVQHAVIPMTARTVVRFASGSVDRLAWVNEWGIPSFRAGSLMTGKWRGVGT